MKRTLTGIAAAAVVLGSAAPMAFAATSTGLSKAGQLPIVVNGSVLSNPFEMTGKDSGNTTAFFPVYYFNQALAKIGFTATWDGVTHTWAIQAPGVDASKISVDGGVGTGNTSVTVNGTTVKKFNTQAAKDPAGGPSAQATTYLPVFYINNILTALGVNGSFTGQAGLSIKGGTTVVGSAALSPVTVTGNVAGSGTQASPAIAQGSNALTLTTKLTDANGNAVANANVSVVLDNSAVVQQGSNFLSLTHDATAGTYTGTATTDATGTVSIKITGSGAYSVEFDAPYTASGNTPSQKAYIAFVGTNPLVTPAGTGSTPFGATTSSASNATTGLVPVTITLPLDSNNKVQSGQSVTFTLNSKGDGSHDSGAFFASSTGASLGTNTYTTTTDANGQATVYVNSYTDDASNAYAEVDANWNSTNYPTDIQWTAPATTSNLSAIGVYPFTSSFSGATSATTSLSGIPGGQEVYVVPFSSSAQLTKTTVTYNLSATNGAVLTNVAGYDLTSNSYLKNLSSAVVTATYNSSTHDYTIAVDGQTVVTSQAVPYFTVTMGQGTNGGATSTLTISSGSDSATVGYGFSSTQSYAKSFSPIISSLHTYGSSENVSYTVVDANGNPVANQATSLAFDGSATGVWLTAVNGTALQEGLGSNGSAVATPVPLYAGPANINYTSVSIPGVVSWSHSNNPDLVTVFTNAQGQATLTLQNGNVPFWSNTASGSVYYDTSASASGTTYAFTYVKNSAAGTQGSLYLSNTGSSDTHFGSSSDNTQVGQINW
ncbi:beta strand repeat-containing protein [Alicyclobacillus dauci]|uniref:Big-1 domain-containing protein n=1 Tax=Alicyclobacillus dauci TaxID=1475485 RepID=A0ABY6Z3H1_9BACL|nr:hypothetical protein [Alicyclobacillus dauci]WAH36839.1 hypothetical protein NZD86_22160 [Alicyclobacillus dauci]